MIRAVVNYVRALPTVDDIDKIGNDVFGTDKEVKVRKLRDSVKYYQSGAKDGYAKLKPTIVAAKKRVGDNIKMECEENGDNDSASYQQNGKKDKSKKKQKRKESGSNSNAEANLVERIALDLDELDLAEVSELVNNSGSEEEKSKKSAVVQALAAGAEVTPSEAGKVSLGDGHVVGRGGGLVVGEHAFYIINSSSKPSYNYNCRN